MPPKPKITKEMIIDAGFKIVREEGMEKITARKISEKLRCSTQPVLYYFKTVDEIRKEVCQKADSYHTDYIMNVSETDENPLLTIGMNYIRFAREESYLFQLLFQTNLFLGSNMPELIRQEEMFPMISVLQQELDVTKEGAEDIFMTLFVFVHGYASLYANNGMDFEEEEIKRKLEQVFQGALLISKEFPN